MTTRVKGLKISQVPELKELTGEEMIPYQYKCTNGKISTSTLADFVSENMDPFDPSGQFGQMQEDIDNLENKVNDLDGVKEQVQTNTNDIKDINDKIGESGTGLGEIEKKLNDLIDSKGEPDGIATLDGTGKLDADQLPDNTINIDGLQLITYEDLRAKADANRLIPGVRYAITNYSCIYRMSVVAEEVEYPATDFKYIICTAVNSNTLDDNVEIIRDPSKARIIEAKYSIYPELFFWTAGMTTKTPKGVIYYLKDENLNSASYDFKHVRFRRWAITDIRANMTKDTGSNTKVSPYRVLVDDVTRRLSDNRQFCGSSDPIEETLVPAIFEGKWRCGNEETPRFPSLQRNNGLALPLTPYHEEYIKRAIKPYKDTDYPADKYLAWQTDMYETGGVSSQYYTSYPHLGGLSDVIVDANDYMDRFTFDMDGEDASEIMIPGSDGTSFAFIQSTSIEQTHRALKETGLPNTVFAISKSLYVNGAPTTSGYMRNNVLSNASRNTFLLSKADPSRNTCQMCHNKLGHNGNQVAGNLIIIGYVFNYNTIDTLRTSYINGAIVRFFGDIMQNNVMFGYYSNFTVKSMNKCLFFGSLGYMRTIDDSAWTVAKDGEYWYDVDIKADFYTNIMGPCQYSYFEPHFNSNLFKGIYNKGVYFDGANQLCSYAWNAWGARFGYGMGQGIYFNTVMHTTVPTIAFSGVDGQNTTPTATGIVKLKPENASRALPNLYEVDIVSSYPADPHTMKDTIPSVTHYPSTKCRQVIYVGSDGAWHLTSWQNIAQGTAAINTLSLEEEHETPMTIEDFAMRYRDMYDGDVERHISEAELKPLDENE